MENPNFIAANDLPIAEGENISVLCVENGEMKQKPATGLGGGGNVCYCAYVYNEDALFIYNNKESRDNAVSNDAIDYDNILSLEEFKNAFFTKSPLIADIAFDNNPYYGDISADLNSACTLLGFYPYSGTIRIVASNSNFSTDYNKHYNTSYTV